MPNTPSKEEKGLVKKLVSKKGISPILATLLLIAIAVAAAIIAYAWVATFVSTQTQQSGAVLVLENVRYYRKSTGANLTDIVIRNTGTANAKVAAVYWSGGGYSELTELKYGDSYDYNYTYPGIIKAESSITITILWGRTLPSYWDPGTTYYYKVVTETGQYLEFPAKAPSIT